MSFEGAPKKEKILELDEIQKKIDDIQERILGIREISCYTCQFKFSDLDKKTGNRIRETLFKNVLSELEAEGFEGFSKFIKDKVSSGNKAAGFYNPKNDSWVEGGCSSSGWLAELAQEFLVERSESES